MLLSLPLVLPLLAASGSSWTRQESGTTAELRGIAAHDSRTAWASGAGGTLLRTRDGEHWERRPIPGGESLDFRDVEAPGGDSVVLMAAGPGDLSRIFRSTDGGFSWSLVHTNPDRDGFYDAMAFWDRAHGLLLGDPVEGRFRMLLTEDGGTTWTPAPAGAMPEALAGEGAFAASGTCLDALAGGREAWFVTGGAKVARVFRTSDRGRSWSVADAPVPAGAASAGLFSLVFLDPQRGFAVGGDYKRPALESLNGARSEDGGASWIPAPVSPAGYFSAVRRVPATELGLIAVGPAGLARSADGGRAWTVEAGTPVNAVALAGAETGWAVGPKGTILKLKLPAR